MTTVLIVGSQGRSSERIAEHAADRGLDTLGVAADEETLRETARAGPAMVRMVAVSDAAVPVVAHVAAELGVPGIGPETAHLVSHRVAFRRRLAEAGVPQPEFAAVRTLHEARTAAEAVGYPALLYPANAPGSHVVFRLEYEVDLESHLYAALAESPTQEAIVERTHDGRRIDAVAVATGGHVEPLALLDRVAPQAQVHPTMLFGDALEAVEDVVVRTLHALGVADALATARLVMSDDGPRVLDVSARVPDEGTVRLLHHALGLDIVEIALLQALGEDVPAALLAARVRRPAAVLALTGDPGPLPTGTVRRVGPLDKVLAFPGVVEAETSLAVGETIDSARLDSDRHGFLIATGDTNLEAHDRAEAAARLVDVEVW